MLNNLIKELNSLENSKQANLLSSFFKTKKGQYGEGDIFLGIKVPIQRKIAKRYKSLKLTEIQKLLNSNIHEYRLTALIILILQYKNNKEKIFNFYLKNTKNINNWDLVDITAPRIVGHFLLNKDKKILHKLAKSNNLWEKRIAIVSTLNFIKNNQLNHTLKISKILLNDKHDLIHKAIGWMLREIGKKDQKLLEQFLDQNIKQIPRTTLRYAIEKFPKQKRKEYLNK